MSQPGQPLDRRPWRRRRWPGGRGVAAKTRAGDGTGAQLGDRAAGDEAAVGEDADAVAELLDELELVGREEDGDAGVGLLAQRRRHRVDGQGIEAGEGLVEDEGGGVVGQRGRQLDALLVAERQRLDPVGAVRGDPQGVLPVGGVAVGLGAGEPVEAREIDELVVDAHLRVEAAFLGHVADRRARGGGDRVAVEEHPAGGRRRHAEHDPHRRRLAGAVRPDEAEDFARANLEGHVVEGATGRVVLRQVLK